MNWKQFKKRLLEEHKNLCFVDRQKCMRGYNEVRILRFFFCGNFKPIVEKLNSIGFYFLIERLHFEGIWTIEGYPIEKDTQKSGECYFRFSGDTPEEIYLKSIEKVKEIMRSG